MWVYENIIGTRTHRVKLSWYESNAQHTDQTQYHQQNPMKPSTTVFIISTTKWNCSESRYKGEINQNLSGLATDRLFELTIRWGRHRGRERGSFRTGINNSWKVNLRESVINTVLKWIVARPIIIMAVQRQRPAADHLRCRPQNLFWRRQDLMLVAWPVSTVWINSTRPFLGRSQRLLRAPFRRPRCPNTRPVSGKSIVQNEKRCVPVCLSFLWYAGGWSQHADR